MIICRHQFIINLTLLFVMKKIHVFWPDNVVADTLLSNKLTFLSGVYVHGQLIKAHLYEQSLRLTPEGEDETPVLIREVSLNQTPLLFSMSGGKRWHLFLEQKVLGFKLECEKGKVHGHLKKVKEVTYVVKYDYTHHEHFRTALKETGKVFNFKQWPLQEVEHFFEGQNRLFIPVYLLPEGVTDLVSDEKKHPCYSAEGERARLLGCDVLVKGHFCCFLPAERLPKELVKYFSR